jgi:hypothetical protein
MHLIETIFIKIRVKPELLEHVVQRGPGTPPPGCPRCPHAPSPPPDGRIEEFFMFTTVATNVNDPDNTGMRARRAAVECFKLVQVPPS